MTVDDRGTVALVWRFVAMEELTLAHIRPPRHRSVTDAYQAAAWRSPSADRFDSRVANDFGYRAEAAVPAESEEPTEFPRWLIVVAGALIASLLAVFAANAMAL